METDVNTLRLAKSQHLAGVELLMHHMCRFYLQLTAVSQ